MKVSVSILDFGAVPSPELHTERIQAAIDHCFLAGGGEVVVPVGTFRTGCIRLRSHVTLHLLSGAVLEGSRNPEDYCNYLSDKLEPIKEYENESISLSVYPFSRWNNALIRAIDAEGIAILGDEGSVIDGRNCYDSQGEEQYRGPHGINMQNCKGIVMRGYTLQNSSNWAHAIFNSSNIEVDRITVLGGHDGFDVRTCDNVVIRDSHFFTGDDCIAGFDNINVLVKACELNSACSAFRFGATNMLVEDCTIFAPAKYAFRNTLTHEEKVAGVPTGPSNRRNMLSAFTYYCDFRAVIRETPGNIVVRNCTMENPDQLLRFNFSGTEPWQANRPLKSIRFENIRVTGLSKPSYLYGTAGEPVVLELLDATITAREGCEDMEFMHAANYERITMKNVKLHNMKTPHIRTWTDGRIESTDSTPVTVFRSDKPFGKDCV